MEREKARSAQRILLAVTVLMLGLLCWVLWRSGFFEAIRTAQGMEAYIQRFSPYSYLVFFFLQLISVILAPIPSNLTTMAGAVLFGTLPAFFLTAGAVVLGSVIVFQLSRVIGKPFVEWFVSSKNWEKYGEIIRRKRDTFLFLAFLFPFFPDDMLCILAGLTELSLRRFLLIVLLARPWGLLFASALGGASLGLPPWVVVPIGLLGLAVFLLGMKYGDKVEEKVLTRLKERRQGKME